MVSNNEWNCWMQKNYPSLLCVVDSSYFVDTEIYKILLYRVGRMDAYGFKGLLILGPKGSGKSRALKQLCKGISGVYVDLEATSLTC